MTTPSDQLYAGTLGDFADSMAEEIELAYKQMLQYAGLPPLSNQDTRDRRILFISIARGVINHLQKHQRGISLENLLNHVNQNMAAVFNNHTHNYYYYQWTVPTTSPDTNIAQFVVSDAPNAVVPKVKVRSGT